MIKETWLNICKDENEKMVQKNLALKGIVPPYNCDPTAWPKYREILLEFIKNLDESYEVWTKSNSEGNG